MQNQPNVPMIILDFGSQYTQLIARRIRELGVYCEIFPPTVPYASITQLSPAGIILSGGPASTLHAECPQAPDWVFTKNLPVLGICYGMQTMATQLGGQVAPASKREYGHAKIDVLATNPLILNGMDVWMSHGDHVTLLPDGFTTICASDNAPHAGMAHLANNWYGLQFHPEVTHTKEGKSILERFVINICQAPQDWNMQCILRQATDNICSQVGQDQVLLALSGGVDSSVLAALLQRAIPNQVIAVFVDTGLLRAQEAEAVINNLAHLGLDIKLVHAQQQFLQALRGVTCPETKRKIIGKTFIDVFQAKAREFNNIKWLAQGTIYPDVIESAGLNNSADKIKSHHNVGGLPANMHLKLLEPLRTLFKDEVRKLGLQLGLDKSIVYRHPFPGAGLAVRILGEVTAQFLTIVRAADDIFIKELIKADLYNNVAQAFAVFLPVKSVGVKGDGRHYEYVICLRSVQTTDFMTADWSALPWDFLNHVATRIMNEVPMVSRVTYDISNKPPATIEWE